MARDSQRSRVYTWESSITYYRNEYGLSLDECQDLADEVSAYYGYPTPHVRDGRGQRKADYHDIGHRIDIPRTWRSRHVVLHEVAHGLTSQMCGLEVAAHGPEFVRIAMTLYQRWAGARLRDMLYHIEVYKVKVASPHVVRHNWTRPDPQPGRRAVGHSAADEEEEERECDG